MTRRFGWAVMTVLAGLVAIYAIGSALIPSIRTQFVASLFEDRAVRALGHLAGGGIALAVGALQFSTRIRLRRPVVHRLLGRVYLATVLFSGISAALLAPFSAGGVPAHFGFGMLAVLWLGTSAAALVQVRARDFSAHRAWMIRSYALCLAAVTLRIYLPVSQVLGIPFDQAYPAIAWLCWVPNLLVAEWFLLRSSVAPLDPAASAA